LGPLDEQIPPYSGELRRIEDRFKLVDHKLAIPTLEGLLYQQSPPLRNKKEERMVTWFIEIIRHKGLGCSCPLPPLVEVLLDEGAVRSVLKKTRSPSHWTFNHLLPLAHKTIYNNYVNLIPHSDENIPRHGSVQPTLLLPVWSGIRLREISFHHIRSSHYPDTNQFDQNYDIKYQKPFTPSPSKIS